MNANLMKATGLFMVLLALSGCQNSRFFTIGNQATSDVTDLSVVVSYDEVQHYLADTNGIHVVVKNESGELLPSQCDDLNGDGKWDELAFLCNLKAGETKKVIFEATDDNPEFPVRTNIRFGSMTKPFQELSDELRMKTNDTKFTTPVYQMEGPAWENDRIAFRNYYDARNGIDIFGKRTADMVMDSVGVNGRQYHTLADWGMDILKVGNSLGAGAIAIGIGDSLYRVGPCEEGRYRLVTEGPVRAMLEFTYKKVPAGNRVYDITHRISIHAGDPFYRSEVWVNNLRGDEELVTGIVNLHNVPADTLTEGAMKIMYSLGNQAYDGEVLGMGVIFPSGQFKRFREAPTIGDGIVNTHLVSLVLRNQEPARYYFVAAWESRDEQVKDTEYFRTLLKAAANKIASFEPHSR
jgi:hypothetical protein